jgi:uncharacterized damage-inducible protein DinB
MRWADDVIADALEIDPNPNAESVRLFGHIAAVEHLWFSRIHGGVAAYPVWPNLTPRESRALAAEQANLFDELVTTHDDAALDRAIPYTNSAGHSFQNSISDIVIHATMHGEHHRGQIARLLREAGREPPYTDYIQFARRDQ